MKRLETIELERPYRFQSPFGNEEFVALIVACDPAITDDEQAVISEGIVAQGCRWAVCAGHKSSTWDDSIDLAYLRTDENLEPPDATHVMTTWHDDEEPGEIARFFVNDTSFDYFEARNMLLVLVGCDADTQRRYTQAVRQELGLGS